MYIAEEMEPIERKTHNLLSTEKSSRDNFTFNEKLREVIRFLFRDRRLGLPVTVQVVWAFKRSRKCVKWPS